MLLRKNGIYQGGNLPVSTVINKVNDAITACKMTKKDNDNVKSKSVTVVRSAREYKGEYKLVARSDIPSSTSLFKINGVLTNVPTRYSVQVGSNLHIDIPESYGLKEIIDQFYWRFMNHSCEPNTLIRNQECFSLRSIDEGEEITFNYNTTEYELAKPFDCRCGSDQCAGRIRGFRFLSCLEQERLRPLLADHLLSFLKDNPCVMASPKITKLCR
jgi:hypothetical protein